MARLKLKSLGKEHEIILSIDYYANNNNLAIQMWHIEDGVLLPWSILTVNTDKRCKPNCAFIDTNNNGDHIVEWLEANNLGMPTGDFEASGFCLYPEFEFNMDEVNKYVNKPTKYIIGRPINGITINGLEYILDDNGNPMTFINKDIAEAVILNAGYTHEDIESGNIIIEEYKGEEL